MGFDILSSQEIPQNKELTAEEIASLLAAVGNHDWKCLTLLLMADGTEYYGEKLRKELLRKQPVTDGISPHSSTLSHYCEFSFSPIGVVAHPVVEDEIQVSQYIITLYGKRIGVPFAGLLLDFSLRYNISLSTLLGRANSSAEGHDVQVGGEEVYFKLRAPYTRFLILEAIANAQDGKIRNHLLQSSLEEILGENTRSRIETHLKGLYVEKLIARTEVEEHGARGVYQLVDPTKAISPEDEAVIRQNNNYSGIALAIYKMITASDTPADPISLKDVNTQLSSLRNREKSYQEKHIKNALGLLMSVGYVKKIGSDQSKTEYSILEEKMALIREFITLVRLFQNGNLQTIEQGKQKAKEILQNPEKVHMLMALAQDSSVHSAELDKDQVAQNILHVLQEADDSLSSLEIAAQFADGYISPTRVRHYLNQLLQNPNNKVEVEGKGKNTRYFVRKNATD